MSSRWTATKTMIHRIGIFSVVCGLLITPLDSLQVGVGVQLVADRPWFIPIQFALVGACIAVFSKIIDPDPRPESHRSLVMNGVLFAGGYLCTAPQAKGGAATTLVYYVFLLAVMAFRARKARLLRETLLFALLLALIGSATEVLVVYLGGFSYNGPTVLGIPKWLPMLYASAAPLVRGLAAETSQPSGVKEIERG